MPVALTLLLAAPAQRAASFTVTLDAPHWEAAINAALARRGAR